MSVNTTTVILILTSIAACISAALLPGEWNGWRLFALVYAFVGLVVNVIAFYVARARERKK